MSEHVIALDPGGRSGWASARMDADSFELTGGGVLRMDHMGRWFARKQKIGPVDGPRLHECKELGLDGKTELWVPCFQVMVYESWKPRRDGQGKMDWIENDELVNAQHIGQLRLIADLSGTRIVEQHPSDKPMAVATMPEPLRAINKYSNEQHDQDARMHLWLYFWRNWFTGKVPPETTVKVA